MRNQKFYAFTALSILSAVLTAVLIQNLSGNLGVAAGVTALGALGFYELAERKASRTGKDRNMKILSSLTKPLYEVIILVPLLVKLVNLDLSNPMFQYLAFSVLGTVLLAQLVEEKMINRLRKSVRPQLGQKIRLGTIALTLFLSALNPFYIFYGMAIVCTSAAYDFFDVTYRSARD